MAVHFKKFVIKNNFLTDASFGSGKLSEIIVGSYVNFSGKVREVRSFFFVRLKCV